jgi:hypothetical protein
LRYQQKSHSQGWEQALVEAVRVDHAAAAIQTAQRREGTAGESELTAMTKSRPFLLLLTAGLLAQLPALSADPAQAAPSADGAQVPYPNGYRHWTFLHSSLVPPTFGPFKNKPCVKPCTGGIFHFYANDKAMRGLRTGSYPQGAVLTEEMLEFIGEGGKEGERRIVGVMVKDSRHYAATGGWGYGNYESGSRTNTLDAQAQGECHQCHLKRKEHGYVFSEYVER